MKVNLHYAILLLLLFIAFKYTLLEWGRENIERLRNINILTEFIFQERHIPSSYMIPFSSIFFPSFLHQQVIDNFAFFLFMDDVIYFSLFCEGLFGVYILYYCFVPLYYVKGLHDVTPGSPFLSFLPFSSSHSFTINYHLKLNYSIHTSEEYYYYHYYFYI